jgi:hypothetical protein
MPSCHRQSPDACWVSRLLINNGFLQLHADYKSRAMFLLEPILSLVLFYLTSLTSWRREIGEEMRISKNGHQVDKATSIHSLLSFPSPIRQNNPSLYLSIPLPSRKFAIYCYCDILHHWNVAQAVALSCLSKTLICTSSRSGFVYKL